MKTAPSRVPSAERRRQILAAATKLFARQGFHGTTTRQIAKEVGVEEIILFRLFPSKEELYWAVIEAKCQGTPARRSLESRLAVETDDAKLFTGIAADLLERMSADPSLTRLLLFSALESHELSDRFYRQYAAEYYETLAAHVRRGIRAGRYRRADPLLAARAFVGMVFYHHLVQELFGARRYEKFSVAKVANEIASIWLEGMKTK